MLLKSTYLAVLLKSLFFKKSDDSRSSDKNIDRIYILIQNSNVTDGTKLFYPLMHEIFNLPCPDSDHRYVFPAEFGLVLALFS